MMTNAHLKALSFHVHRATADSIGHGPTMAQVYQLVSDDILWALDPWYVDNLCW